MSALAARTPSISRTEGPPFPPVPPPDWPALPPGGRWTHRQSRRSRSTSPAAPARLHAADAHLAVDGQHARAADYKLFTLDGGEARQSHRHAIGAGRQFGNAVLAGAIGRGAADFLDQHGARGFDSDAGHPAQRRHQVVAVGGEALVTEWLESPYSLAHVIREGTQEERDHYGELLARFLFVGPDRTGMLHADPHPGNFRVAEDGRRGVLDFGAVNRLPQGLPPAMGRLLTEALAHGGPVGVFGRGALALGGAIGCLAVMIKQEILLIFVGGLAVFRSSEPRFADTI